MATGPLSIKLRCASWPQLATIYKRDLSRSTMFLKASSPPPIGTEVRIDLTLPSGSVILLSGAVDQHLTDPQRGAGVEVKLVPIPPAQIYMIESALATEAKRRKTPASGVQVTPTRGGSTPASGVPATPMRAGTSGPVAAIGEGEEVSAAEQELVTALLAEAESLRKLNPFLVLGVGYEATDSDVRAAFGELTKRYHPDLFARYESKQLRETAAEIFIVIRDAYRKLAQEAGRQQALASIGRPAAPRAVPLRAPTPPPVPARVPMPRPPMRPSETKIAEPEPPRPATDFAHTARTSFDAATARAPEVTPSAGVPRAAPTPTVPMPAGQAFPASKVTSSQSMKPATGTEPPPPVVQTDRKPVNVAPPPVDTSDSNPLDDMLDAGKFDEALAAYRLMSKKSPTDRTARAGIELCEGLRALSNRDRLEAAQRFESALEIDPSNERAARELADMRRQATNERKGLLTRLMGKKEQ